tara:strand:- start:486 stop:722 length:237 start_codon:yes stop_codon:yes gene_type:complete
MEKKAKLIWEFFGEDGLETAKHHAIHLEEFAKKENIQHFGCGTVNKEQQAEAYLIVEQKNMITVRDALRPKRGEWVDT